MILNNPIVGGTTLIQRLQCTPLFLFFSLCLLSGETWGAEVHYRVSIPRPQTHMIQVEMTLDGVRGDAVIGMPVWTPGSYLVREFGRHVQDISAVGHDNHPLAIEKMDKNHWKIEGRRRDQQIVVRYQVYAFEHSVRTSFVNADHALINGASVFMYWKNHLSKKHTLDLELPEAWATISTSLLPFDRPGNTTFMADDYDELVDSPFELGNQHEIRFQVDGKPHLIALYGSSNYSDSILIRDFTKIILTEKAIWGELPYDHYVFIFNLGDSGGGLEHKNSSVMFARRWTFNDKIAYHSFLSLVAHEFFHTWNIKRLRPAGLGPFDYDLEAYTKSLWFVEGFTSYYDELMLLRAGFYTPDDYLAAVTGQINTLENRPGKFHQSLSEASWDAWIKHYRPDEHSDNSTISYYNKGALVGMLLNLKIMTITSGQKSLDDLMRLLYERHYLRSDSPYTTDAVQQAVKTLTGADFGDFFRQFVDSTVTLPYADYLNFAGLRTDTTATDSAAYLGVEARESNGRFIIRRVIENTPAWEAGLNVDDELIALNGFRVRQFPPAILSEFKPGQEIMITVSRDGVLNDLSLKLGVKPVRIESISRMQNPTEQQRTLYRIWLGQVWPAE